MKTNKVIGIPGYIYQNGSYGVGPNYLEFASKFGNPRIIMPWEELADIDVLLCPGGPDLSPDIYGEIPGFRTGNNDVHKDFFYRKRLKNYIDNNIPIFSICLGSQAIAAHFGLKLRQNLVYHAQSKERWSEAHDVHLVNGEKGIRKFKVNSHHHQCVMGSEFLKDKCELIPLYYSVSEDDQFIYNTKDVIIEAFKHKDKEIYCVQWHPEENYDTFSMEIMKKLTTLKTVTTVENSVIQ